MKSESTAPSAESVPDVPGQGALHGCNVLVVGATGATGWRAARALGLSGARVMLCDREADGLESAMQDLQALGIDTRWVAADCAQALDVARLVQAMLERMGDIDVLVTALPEAAMAARVADEVVRLSMGPQQRGSVVHLAATPEGAPRSLRLFDTCVRRQALQWQGLGVRVNALLTAVPVVTGTDAESFDAALRLFAGAGGQAFTGQSLTLGGAGPAPHGA